MNALSKILGATRRGDREINSSMQRTAKNEPENVEVNGETEARSQNAFATACFVR
jgi:hypothetical protein